MYMEISEMNRNVEELLKEMRAIHQLLQELVNLGHQNIAVQLGQGREVIPQ